MEKKTHTSTNQYRIIEPIGEGSNSVVYKAIQSDLKEQIQLMVALKVLKSDELVKIWKAEFDSLKRIRSRHCISIYGFEWVMDRPALALEFVDGISLSDLYREVPLTAEIIRQIGIQILIGLEDLWKEGLCHGDLSPSNVLIDQQGLVKLVDFGLGNWEGNRRLTTPQFTAPEVLSSKSVSKGADIYSLGKILDFLTDIYLEEKDLVQAISQMTEVDSQTRRVPSWSNHLSAKEALAQRVQSALEKRKKEVVKTQEFIVRSVSYPYKQQLKNVDVQRLKSKKMLNLLWGLFLVVIIFVGSWLYQLTKANVEAEGAALVIRSHRWYRVWINDKDYGFTPLDIRDLPAENIRIRWQSSSESGMRSLTLQPGVNRVNGDEFFRSE